MRRGVLAPLAEADLDEIWLHLATVAAPDVADRTVDTIVRAIEVLERHPQAGRARPDIHDDARSFPAGHYVIYYRAAVDSFEIARVLHGSRDPHLARP